MALPLDSIALTHPQPYPSSPSLDGIEERFIYPLDQGMHSIYPALQTFFFDLAILEFGFFFLYMVIGKNQSFQEIIQKLLEFAFLYYLFAHFPSLVNQLLNGLLYFVSGTVGISQASAVAAVQSPDALLTTSLQQVIGPLNTFLKLPQFQFDWTKVGAYFNMLVWYGAAVFAATICFLVMAIQLAIALIEYKIVLALAWILFPFSVFKPTEFLAKPSLTSVVGHAMKLVLIVMVTSLITSAYTSVVNANYIAGIYTQISTDNLSASVPVLNIFLSSHGSGAASTEATLFDLMYAICAISVFSIFLSLQVPAIVGSLMGGLPNLSASGLFQNVAGLARLAATAGRGGGGAAAASGGRAASSSPRGGPGGGSATPASSSPPSSGGGRSGGGPSSPQLPPGGGPNGPNGPQSEASRLRAASSQNLPPPPPMRQVGPSPAAEAQPARKIAPAGKGN